MPLSVRSWFTNTGKKYLLLLIWMSACSLLFWRTYSYYKYDPSFYYVHQMLGPWLCISRGSAAVLNLNCGLVLLPMCRFTISAVRRCHRRVSLETVRLLLDTCKGLHIACAVCICVNAVIHFTAHVFNARNFSMFYNRDIPTVNGAHSPHEDPIKVVLTTVPGITGCLMFILLVVIVTSSTRFMREVNYDLFWYTHRLIALFYLLLLVHAVRGPIRQQINVSAHTPGCNASITNVTEPVPEPEAEYSFAFYTCAEEPHFGRIGCQSWLWVGVPLFLYIVDKLCRLRQKETRVLVTQAVRHPGDILEVAMESDMRIPSPGQYVLVQCPHISAFEWHPYSVTRCPTKDNPEMSIHIRARGDWSERLDRHVFELEREGCDFDNTSLYSEDVKERGHRRLELSIDGPYGGPLDKVPLCNVAVCIAGGIGITPFISVINYIRRQIKRNFKCRRLYLIWIFRSSSELQCFIEDIKSTHYFLWDLNLPDVLDVRFYCTGKEDVTQVPQDISHDNFVIKRLSTGRPDLDKVFYTLSEFHKRASFHALKYFAFNRNTKAQKAQKNRRHNRNI